MDKINLEEKFGEAINSVWEEFSSKTATEEYCKISPTCIDFANHHSVLFIGLNPSLRKTDIESAQKWDTNKKALYFRLKVAQHGKDEYYNSFKKLAEGAGLASIDWSYLDLTFIRHTSQKEIQDFCYSSTEASQFVLDQLQITKNIIEEIDPKAIIVTNKFAETLLGKHKKKDGSNAWMDLKFEPTDNADIYTWNNIPVIFTGYLKFKSASEKEQIQEQIRKIQAG